MSNEQYNKMLSKSGEVGYIRPKPSKANHYGGLVLHAAIVTALVSMAMFIFNVV